VAAGAASGTAGVTAEAVGGATSETAAAGSALLANGAGGTALLPLITYKAQPRKPSMSTRPAMQNLNQKPAASGGGARNGTGPECTVRGAPNALSRADGAATRGLAAPIDGSSPRRAAQAVQNFSRAALDWPHDGQVTRGSALNMSPTLHESEPRGCQLRPGSGFKLSRAAAMRDFASSDTARAQPAENSRIADEK